MKNESFQQVKICFYFNFKLFSYVVTSFLAARC